jgi:hypothetical protein
MPLHVSVSYDHLQKTQQHDEATTITLIIVHQVESKFYMKILIKIKCGCVKKILRFMILNIKNFNNF